MTARVYDHRDTSGNSRSANSRDVGCPLGSLLADANGIGFACHASVVDVDIVATCRQIKAGVRAERDVAFACCVVGQGILTDGGVVASAGVSVQRTLTIPGIVVAFCIAVE